LPQRWTATENQIKAAYRRAALLHHPDKQAALELDEAGKKAAEDKFKRVQEAYETLSDPAKVGMGVLVCAMVGEQGVLGVLDGTDLPHAPQGAGTNGLGMPCAPAGSPLADGGRGAIESALLSPSSSSLQLQRGSSCAVPPPSRARTAASRVRLHRRL
jgi:curved DNA-binding protein CbpA